MDQKIDIQEEIEELKKQGYYAICFWLPSYSVGGGVLYFCALARYLDNNTDLNIYFMDYKDGFATLHLKDTCIKMLEYQEEHLKFPLEEKCVVVTNSTRVIQIKQMRPDNKLLFYHYETVRCAWDALFLQGEAKRFIQLCQNENAMVFHDWSARDILNRQFNMNFNQQDYLHLILTQRKLVENSWDLISEDEIHIAWLGRIAPDKIQSLCYVIRTLNEYVTDRKKVIHIIGDGRSMNQLRKFVQKYKKAIEFRFTGTMKPERLNEYLVKNADILFAMGTSTLEGASQKIPTVVVQLDTVPITNDSFYWLFNTKEYCVGILVEQKESFDVEYTDMGNILDQIYEEEKKKEYGEKCYIYFIENFSDYNQLLCSFIRFINCSTLTADKLEKEIKYIPYNHLKVKKISFLGRVIYQKPIFISEEIENGIH